MTNVEIKERINKLKTKPVPDAAQETRFEFTEEAIHKYCDFIREVGYNERLIGEIMGPAIRLKLKSTREEYDHYVIDSKVMELAFKLLEKRRANSKC
jgi:hypothetical protein